VTEPEIVLVPGGWGVAELERDEEFLSWVRAVHAKTRFTASVCTGSLLLGAAGLLEGVDATTHWARVESLEGYGARYLPERIVTSGKIITAAGVSAGIDMALALSARLSSRATAEAIQLSIEYDPAPPFDSGSPGRASASVRDLVLARTRDKLGRRRA
jgi:transcriptional regulator GlxA family with amidase domain